MGSAQNARGLHQNGARESEDTGMAHRPTRLRRKRVLVPNRREVDREQTFARHAAMERLAISIAGIQCYSGSLFYGFKRIIRSL